MRRRRRVVNIVGATIVGAATGIVAPLSAHAASTATAWVSSGSVTYEAATGQANAVKVAKVFTSTGAVRWEFADVVRIAAGTGCYHPTRTGLKVVWCDPGPTSLIVVRTLDLDDTILVTTNNTMVQAGAGNDTVVTPNNVSYVSYVYGEGGDDTVWSGTSRDAVDGGPGIDVINYQNRVVRMCADLFGWASPPGGGPLVNACEIDDREDLYLNGSVENIVGGSNDEVFMGNAATNRFDGGAGNDEIHTGGGDDTVYGGAGNDNISSGPGANELHGGAGNDYLVDNGYPAAVEWDVLDGGPDVDTCQGWNIETRISCEVVLDRSDGQCAAHRLRPGDESAHPALHFDTPNPVQPTGGQG